MELCGDLFCTPKKLTRSRMFGHYLHAITAHSPAQYEITCLRSLNTENQERLFGQARSIAEACTNHHPDNVIPQIMLRLQVKQEQHQALLSVQKGDSQVSHIAKELPHLPGTTVKMSFIKQREDSWQLHLQQISPFLIAGEGVWWTRRPNGFHFHDGDQDSSTKDDGLDLLHHRHHSIQDAEERRRKCWKKIIDDTIIIPANSIKVYNTQGNPIGKMVYSDKGVIQKNLLTSTVGDQAPQTPDSSSLLQPGNPDGSSPLQPDDSLLLLPGNPDGSSPLQPDDSLLLLPGDTDGSSLLLTDNQDGSSLLLTDNQDGSFLLQTGNPDGSYPLQPGNPDGSSLLLPGDTNGSSLLLTGNQDSSSLLQTGNPDGSSLLQPGDTDGSSLLQTGDTDGSSLLLPGDTDGSSLLLPGDTDGSSLLQLGESSISILVDPPCLTRETPSAHIHAVLEKHNEGMKTSLGNSIKKLVHDKRLEEFDDLRFNIKMAKKNKKQYSDLISRYNLLSAQLGTKILTTQSKLNKSLTEIERQHLNEHSILPTKQTNSNYCKILKERNLATAVLRNMNIDI